MSISPPGGVSWLWALIYLAAGFYLVPLLLSLVGGKVHGTKKDSAPAK